jgi:hypothetical protein
MVFRPDDRCLRILCLNRGFLMASVLVAAAWLPSLAGPSSAPSSLIVTVYHTSPGMENPSAVPCYGVFELTFVQPNDYGGDRNFLDVDVRVTFTGPVSGRKTTVGGFFYDTLSKTASLWKARFAPAEAGTWTYSYTFTHTPTGKTATGEGSFQSVQGAHRGFIRPNPLNPFRWQTEQGGPFVPIGFNDCVTVNNLMNFDGGDVRGAFLGPMRIDEYLEAYEDAGFNMFRFSQDNCSPKLLDASLHNYDRDVAMHFDLFMRQLHDHQFRIYYGLLGSLLPEDPTTPPPPELFRFMDYSINRWGAYVDIWEIQNERRASAEWIITIASYLRERDPYKHPIATSDERPDLNVIDINTPHTYVPWGALEIDWRFAGDADALKTRFGKPVIFGEIGNSPPQGSKHGNWLPESALRMRIMSWTAFFRETSLLFWNTSYATNGSGPNIYLGLEERQYVHVLQWFANLVIRSDSSIMALKNPRDFPMRAYGLTSSDGIALYIQHCEDHSRPLSGQSVTVDIPADGQGFWLDPATGKKLGSLRVTKGPSTLAIPDFEVDVAFLSTSTTPFETRPIAIVEIGAPQTDRDLDRDGVPDFGPTPRPFGLTPLILAFRGGNSSDLDGGRLSYLWQFGDGTPSETQADVTHIYGPGNFLAQLTVTDDEGNRASESFVVRSRENPSRHKNHAPLVNTLLDVTTWPGELVMITPWAVDRKLGVGSYADDKLDYRVKGLPPGATFGRRGADGSRQFWWVPDFSQAGIYHLEFSVRDGHGLEGVPQKVNVTVLEAPRQKKSESSPDAAGY